MMKLKKKTKKNPFKTKEIIIKRVRTKFNIKIIWYKMLNSGIKNKIQLDKR